MINFRPKWLLPGCTRYISIRKNLPWLQVPFGDNDVKNAISIFICCQDNVRKLISLETKKRDQFQFLHKSLHPGLGIFLWCGKPQQSANAHRAQSSADWRLLVYQRNIPGSWNEYSLGATLLVEKPVQHSSVAIVKCMVDGSIVKRLQHDLQDSAVRRQWCHEILHCSTMCILVNSPTTKGRTKENQPKYHPKIKRKSTPVFF